MAKVVSDEILKLKIVVNGDEAQKRILDIEMANKKLSNSIDEERAKLKKLNANKAKNRLEIDRTKASIAKLTAEYDQNLRRIDDEIRAMDHMALTTGQLKRRMDELSFTMRHMNPNDPNYKLAQAELAKLDSRYRQLRSGMGATAFSFKELSDKINQYSALITTAIVVTTAVVLAVKNAIDINNKLADAQSAVSKTTGLNIEQVRELTEAFKEFDTRTSQLDLLKIAEIGGRLGVATEEIHDFTREVDKVYVALGDGFSGGVEKVAESLGKLKGLYKETRDIPIAEAMNQIGSAINELGAAGAASEENIAEFGLRVGSLPESLKPSIAEALALGAAFEESGIDAERSGTAYSAFVRTAAKSAADFAKVMGKSREEVEALINSDPMEFFLQFAEGARGLDATKLSEILNSLKLNDQYVISILGAASENTERFRTSIQLSNEELKKATSLQEEFNKVNNNAAAIYDKIKKKFQEAFTSDAVAKTLNWLVEKFGQLIGAIEDTDGTMTKIRNSIIFLTKIILIGVTAVASYNAAVILSTKVFTTATGRIIGFTIAQKFHNIVTTASTMLTAAYNTVVGYSQLALARLTGSTHLQTAAQIKLNAATMANPWGAVLAVVMAVAAAVYLFSKRTDEAAEKQKELARINNEANKGIITQKNELEALLRVARDETASKEARLAAIKKLNEISPEYLGNLTLENINTQKATDAVNKYTAAIYRASRARVLQKKLDEEVEKQMGIRDKPVMETGGGYWNNTMVGRMLMGSDARNLDGNMLEQYRKWEKERGKAYAEQMMKVYGKYYEKRNQELQKTGDTIGELQKEIADLMKADISLMEDGTTSNYDTLHGSEGKKTAKTGKSAAQKAAEAAQKKYESEREKILKTAENYDQKMLELEAERMKNMADLQRDGYEKEYDQLMAETDKTIAALEKKKISEQEFAELRSMIARETGNMQARLQEIEYQWLEENGRIEALQEQELAKTNLKLLTLREKYQTEAIKKEEEGMKKRVDLIEREKNEKLALSLQDQKVFLAMQGYSAENLKKIRTWEDSRKEIEKFYQNQRLTEQLEFLKNKVAEFHVYAAMNPLHLTAEQLDTIEEYKNKIAELVAEIARLKNGTEEGDLGGRLSGIGTGGRGDILGLTPDQWEAMFQNTDKLEDNIMKVAAAVQVLQNMYATYASFMKANEDAMLTAMERASERKQMRLERELKVGIINQEEYKKRTLKNETELEKKKAEIAYKQAKRERAMALAEAITNTAVAVVNALSTQPVWLGIALSALVGTMGAIQIATIMRQPLPEAPGAEEGLYPVLREQDGKLFNARRRRSRSGVYNEPTLLVGEGGSSMPELVVSGRDLKRLDPEITKAFMRDIDRVRGYENGMYPAPPPATSSGTDEMLIRMMTVLHENTQVMKEIKDYGITAHIGETAANGQKIEKMMKEYQQLYNNNKHG